MSPSPGRCASCQVPGGDRPGLPGTPRGPGPARTGSDQELDQLGGPLALVADRVDERGHRQDAEVGIGSGELGAEPAAWPAPAAAGPPRLLLSSGAWQPADDVEAERAGSVAPGLADRPVDGVAGPGWQVPEPPGDLGASAGEAIRQRREPGAVQPVDGGAEAQGQFVVAGEDHVGHGRRMGRKQPAEVEAGWRHPGGQRLLDFERQGERRFANRTVTALASQTRRASGTPPARTRSSSTRPTTSGC
jgi:hypothetical protein